MNILGKFIDAVKVNDDFDDEDFLDDLDDDFEDEKPKKRFFKKLDDDFDDDLDDISSSKIIKKHKNRLLQQNSLNLQNRLLLLPIKLLLCIT